MGLFAAMLGQPSAPGHEGAHASVGKAAMLSRLIRDRLAELGPLEDGAVAGLPGPPPVPRWDSATSPLPDLSLVEAGIRPITGGRRRSF